MEITRSINGDILKIIVDENDTLKDISAYLPVTVIDLVKEMNTRILKSKNEIGEK